MPITRAYASAAQPGNAFLAGKNKIINGDFNINQRAFSSTTTSATYGFDRWDIQIGGDGTCTYSAQTFTAGAAPVTGYEAANYARLLTASQTATNVSSYLRQKIEDVRTFANQTITISFWAKAASGTPKIALELVQAFGSGGSPSSNVAAYGGQVTLSTSWARYSLTVAVPSISGKTIGTTANSSSLNIHLWVSAGSDFNARTGTLGIQNNTFDIWGVQAESGSVATAFQTATGTLAGELAACQRYYYRIGGSAYSNFGTGYVTSTTNFRYMVQAPVTMRVTPTALDSSAANTFNPIDSSNGSYTPTAITFNSTESDPRTQAYDATGSGLTAGRYTYNRAGNTTAAYIGFSAEL